MSPDRHIVLVAQELRPVAECAAASRTFTTGDDLVRALDAVDVAIQEAQLTAIAGPSGSGKSTLLALLGCLDRATSGSVRVLEHEVTVLSRGERRRLRRRQLVTVLPRPADNLLLARSGRQNVELSAAMRGRRAGEVDALADTLGVSHLLDRACGVMSGGEQQRVALACAIAGATPLVLADEPTGALDRTSAAPLVEALLAAARSGSTIVVATHDAMVIEAADAVVRLDHGRRVE